MRIRFDAIGEAWSMVMSDLGNWVVASIVVLAIIYALEIVFQLMILPLTMVLPDSSSKTPADISRAFAFTGVFIGAVGLFSVVITGVQGVTTAWLQRFALIKARGGFPTLGDFFSFDGAIGRVFLWSFLMPLLAGIVVWGIFIAGAVGAGLFASRALDSTGIAILILAGAIGATVAFFIQAIFAFVPLILIDQKLPIVDAARLSFQTLAPNALPMVGVYFCAAFLSGLGACLCGIGIIFTLPLLYATIAVMYNDFFRPQRLPPVAQVAPGEFYPR